MLYCWTFASLNWREHRFSGRMELHKHQLLEEPMLGVIVQHSAEIVTFISWLSLALYQPQIRHLTQLVDALLVCDSRKTLTNLL